MALALTLHLLAAVFWVGGMFFAVTCLRPASAGMDPAPRLQLWRDVLQKFLPMVMADIIILLATGLWMILVHFGGFARIGIHVHIMFGLGLLMMLLALHLRFAPWPRLRRAVDAQQWEDAGRALGQIRIGITINLVLGLVVVAVASGGRVF